MYKALLGIAVAGLMAGSAMAAGVEVKRNGAPEAIFSESVWAGDTLYVSGILSDPDVPADKEKGTGPSWTADTKTQSIGILTKIDKLLKEQGLTLGDVVQLEAFLGGDPSKGGRHGFRRLEHRLQAVFRHRRPAQEAGSRHRAGGQAGRSGRADRDHGHRGSSEGREGRQEEVSFSVPGPQCPGAFLSRISLMKARSLAGT